MLKKLKPRIMPYKTYFKMILRRTWVLKRKGPSKSRVGAIALKLDETCRLQWYQFSALAKLIYFYCHKVVERWFPTMHFCVPLTKKSLGVRMGKGKGKPRHWCVNLLRGTILMEIDYTPTFLTKLALKQLMHRIPARAHLVMQNFWYDLDINIWNRRCGKFNN
jgi:ribosomal protein L16/L10AE